MTALLETRSVQFCILMREFLGNTYMRSIMAAAIDRATTTAAENSKNN